MKASNTYFILGYALRDPFLNETMVKRIADGFPKEDIADRVVLILIDKFGLWQFKQFGYWKKGILHRAYAKNSNYFRFARSIYGVKDKDIGKVLQLNPDNFVGHYITYLLKDKKWVKTPKSEVFEVRPASSLLEVLKCGLFKKVRLFNYGDLI